MSKEYVIKIGKQFVKRGYQGSGKEYLAFGFTSNVNEAKRFIEDEPVENVKNAQYANRKTIERVSSNGLDYANWVAEELGGKVYEVRMVVELIEN